MEEEKELQPVGEAQVNPAGEPVKAPKKFPKVLIPIIAVAAVALAAVLVVINPKVQNSIKQKTMSTEEYYQYAEKKYLVKTAAQNATDIYGSYVVPGKKNGMSGSVKLSLGEELADVLSLLLEEKADGDLSKFRNVTLDYSYNPDIDKKQLGYSAKLSYNGDEVLPMEAVLDFKNNEMYFNVTNLSTQYLACPFDEFLTEEQREKLEQALEAAVASKDLPDQKNVYTVVDKYLNIIIGKLNKVERDEDCTLSKGDVDIKVSQMKIKIDEDTIKGIIEAVGKEASDDKDLYKLIVSICEIMGEDMTQEDAKELVAEYTKKLETMVENMEMSKPITMYVYIDNKGNVVGRKINVSEGTTIELYALDDGKNVYYGIEMKQEYKLEIPGYDSKSVSKYILEGKKKSGKVNGELKVSVNSTVKYGDESYDRKAGIVIEVADFNIDKFKKGELTGTFSISCKSSFTGYFEDAVNASIEKLLGELEGPYATYISKWIKKLKVSFSFDFSDSKFNLKLAAYAGDDLLLELVTENKGTTAEAVATVDKKCADIEAWIEEADWDGFFKKLKKTDLSSDFVDSLEKILKDKLY